MSFNISKIANAARKFAGRHSPEILTGIGVVGMVTAAVMAVRATPKAVRLIEAAEVEKSLALEQGSEGLDGELTPVEAVKVAWKCYIPAAITACASAACLVGACKASTGRSAALATAYALSEAALKEYRDKVKETLGDKKEQSVRDAIAKDRIEHNPVGDCEVIITNKGDTLCYDAISGRYFKSDIEKLRRTANDLSRQLLSEMTVSVNEFYYDIGLSCTKQAEKLGWNVADGLIELRFSAQIADDGTPCLVLDFVNAPRYDFEDR